LHGSVRPVLTGGFADTVAQVSTSSKDVVDGSAGRGELGRCAVVERRVRSMVVVVAPPEVQLPACIGQVEEHLYVQAFVAQSPVEALDVSVLHRAAGLDVDQADLPDLQVSLIERIAFHAHKVIFRLTAQAVRVH